MKIIKILALSLLLMLLTGCGSRVPFKAQEPLENAALVYVYAPVYVSSDNSTTDIDYVIRINNKQVKQRIAEGEYMVFNLKPQQISISATKKQIQEYEINLYLKSGEIYYLKIRENSGDSFDFIEVEKALATKEIAKTGLAGSTAVEKDDIVTEFIGSDKEDQSTKKLSKTDEIEKAYKLKEDGVIQRKK